MACALVRKPSSSLCHPGIREIARLQMKVTRQHTWPKEGVISRFKINRKTPSGTLAVAASWLD